jgi:hypothetical protein
MVILAADPHNLNVSVGECMTCFREVDGLRSLTRLRRKGGKAEISNALQVL